MFCLMDDLLGFFLSLLDESVLIQQFTGLFVCLFVFSLFFFDRLVGLVVKASASRAEGPGFESR